VRGLGDDAIGLARAIEIIREVRQEAATQRRYALGLEDTTAWQAGIIAKLRQKVAELEAIKVEQRDIIESLREQLMPPSPDWGTSPPC
jgi:hypothetical protein